MPFATLSFDEACDYLHLGKADLDRLVSKRDIPFHHTRGQVIFRKNELRDWNVSRLLCPKVGEEHAGKVDKEARRRQHCALGQGPLHELLVDGSLIPFLDGRSKAKVLKALATAAFQTGLAADEDEVLKLLLERDEDCPTGIADGIAFPHTRIHSETLFFGDFIIIGKIPNGIPFGALDGRFTDIFIMPCCSDDVSHLRILSRLALMLRQTDLADGLRVCETAEEMREAFILREQAMPNRV